MSRGVQGHRWPWQGLPPGGPAMLRAMPVVPERLRVLLLGATGTIGRATAHALLQRGHALTCLVRPRAGAHGRLGPDAIARALPGAELRFGDATDAASLVRDGFRGERFDALVSCLASRTGAPRNGRFDAHQRRIDTPAAPTAARTQQRNGATMRAVSLASA